MNLKEVGANVAFNFKTTSTTEVLAKEGPIDMQVLIAVERNNDIADEIYFSRYWDNVAGPTYVGCCEGVCALSGTSCPFHHPNHVF
jgi:hypothetical protein